MQSNILIYEFGEKAVEFNFTNGNVMANATQMGALFGKSPKDFLRNEQTKSFIDECLNKANSPYLNIEIEEDLYTSIPKTGTFMHRVLAIKFAAWLSPAFELWIYKTIDEILFGNMRMIEQSLRESAARKNRMEQVQEALCDNPAFLELEMLRLQEKQAAYARAKIAKEKLNSLRQTEIPL